MYIKGYAKKDSKTKNLIRRLKQNDIAVINHENIDELAANQLIEKRVRAVINCSEFINGYYPNKGPKLLSEAGITLINNIGKERFLQIKENDLIEIESDTLYINKRQLGKIQFLTRESIDRLTNRGKQNLDKLLNDFIDNTLEYATKEKDYILGKLPIPKINLEIKGRHVLVVTRGSNYKSDLNAIKSYLREVRPSKPTGPRACNLSLEIPISAPRPYSKPSAKRVLALTITLALSTSRKKRFACA